MNQNKGQSLLEIIVAIGVFLIVVVGSLSASSYFLDNYQQSKELSKVREIAQETFAAIRSIGYNDWSQITTGTYGVATSSGKWVLTSTPNTILNKYKREVIISSVDRNQDCEIVSSGGNNDPDTKFVSTTVSWSTPIGTSSRSFSRYITRWGNPQNCLPKSKNGIVFTDEEDLKTLPANKKEVKEWDPGDVDILGSMSSDFDSDSNNDIVYLKNKNKIHVIDDNDDDPRKINISNQKAKEEKTILVSENWNGSGTSTYYVSKVEPKNEIYYVDDNENPTQVAVPDNGASAVSGKGDIDRDGTTEFVFVDGSQAVRYIEPSDSIEEAFSKAYDGAGQNNNVGIGEPADFDKDGYQTVPIVNGSNEILLVDSSGKVETVVSDSDSAEPAKSPLGSSDIDGDGKFELVFIDLSDDDDDDDDEEVKYIDDVRGAQIIKQLKDDSNDSIEADTSRGVMGADTND